MVREWWHKYNHHSLTLLKEKTRRHFTKSIHDFSFINVQNFVLLSFCFCFSRNSRIHVKWLFLFIFLSLCTAYLLLVNSFRLLLTFCGQWKNFQQVFHNTYKNAFSIDHIGAIRCLFPLAVDVLLFCFFSDCWRFYRIYINWTFNLNWFFAVVQFIDNRLLFTWIVSISIYRQQIHSKRLTLYNLFWSFYRFPIYLVFLNLKIVFYILFGFFVSPTLKSCFCAFVLCIVASIFKKKIMNDPFSEQKSMFYCCVCI